MSGIVNGKCCPLCGGDIIYNGNYYCEYLERGNCEWAMPEEHSEADNEIIIAYLKQERDDLKNPEWVRDRMKFYLRNSHGIES